MSYTLRTIVRRYDWSLERIFARRSSVVYFCFFATDHGLARLLLRREESTVRENFFFVLFYDLRFFASMKNDSIRYYSLIAFNETRGLDRFSRTLPRTECSYTDEKTVNRLVNYMSELLYFFSSVSIFKYQTNVVVVSDSSINRLTRRAE